MYLFMWNAISLQYKTLYLVDYREVENGAEKIFNCNEWRKYMYELMSSSAVANLMKILQYC